MNIIDFPMKCCGMVEASELSLGLCVYDAEGNFVRNVNDDDYDKMFAKIEEHQRKYQRNCSVIALAPAIQLAATKAALRNGYKEVFKFFNPNSYNQVSVFVKTLWKDHADYDRALASGEHQKPDRIHAIRGIPPYTVNVIDTEEGKALHAM
jgi:hypothetical protein